MSAQHLGHHELLEHLGQGASGVVWKARDLRSGRLVALKVLEVGPAGAALRRFRRGFRAAARLSHPNVVRVLESGSTRLDGIERPWLTMELVEGRTLREILDHEADGWPPERNSAEWLSSRLSLLHQVAAGLAHCHSRGVLHRDLKPTNVLVGDDGQARLVDFGLARLDGPLSSLSDAGQLIGTLAYMSPEQARGGPVDERSDVHGLGCLLHEVASGRRPFRGADLPTVLEQVLYQAPDDPREANPELEPALAELTRRCLAKEPSERPSSAAEVDAELVAIAARLGVRLTSLPRDHAAPGARPVAAGLVGRDSERATLRAALEDARQGLALVAITGPSGAGKSRLLEDLRVDAELLGLRSSSAAASPHARPLGALLGILAKAVGTVPHALRHDVRLLESVLPELGDGQVHDETAATDRLRLAGAAMAVIEHQLSRGPQVLAVDDAQWADALSLEVLDRLLRRAATRPLLIIVVFRDDVLPSRPAVVRLHRTLLEHARGRELVLHPLDPDDTARLVHALLGVRPSEAVTAQLHRSTRGLPHDIVEVAGELAARGAVRRDDAPPRLSIPVGLDLGTLSASEATRSRLSGLGESERRVVEVLAVAGPSLPAELIADVVHVDEDVVLDALETLVGQGLVLDGPGPDVVSLAHLRQREVVLEDVSSIERAALAQAVARALERTATSDEALHRVAELDLTSESLDTALRTVPESARAFASAGLHAEAVERHEALIALAGRLDRAAPVASRHQRALLLAEAGRTEESVQAHAELAADASTHDELPPWSSLRYQAFALMLLSRHDEALEVAAGGHRTAAEAGETAACSQLLSVMGTMAQLKGDVELSWQHHREAVRVGRESGDESVLTKALHNLGIAAHRDSRLPEASAALREAVTGFDRLGHATFAANSRSNLAAVLIDRGELDAARVSAREAMTVLRGAGELRGLALVLELAGRAALVMGELEEAEAQLEESLGIRERLGESWAEAQGALALSATALHRGRWARARELLERARRLFEDVKDRERLAVVLERLGTLAWTSSPEPSAARPLLEEAARLARRHGTTKTRLESELAVARLDGDDGRDEDALQRLEDGLKKARDRGLTLLTDELASERVVARLRAGELDGLEDEAERLHAGIASRPALAAGRDLLIAAAVLDTLGHRERAAALRTDGLAHWARARDALCEEERSSFENQWALRRLRELTTRRERESTMSVEEKDELERLRLFHSLVMSSDPSRPDSLFEAFLDGALPLLGFARGLVFVSEDDELRCRAARDRDGRDVPPDSRLVPDRLLRRALLAGEPVLSLELADDPTLTAESSVTSLGIESFAAVPVTPPEGAPLVAYFDGPPPTTEPRVALERLAPVFRELGRLLARSRRAEARAERAEAILSSIGAGDSPLIGSSAGLDDLRRLIATVAPTDASVLVLGENGTGKELVAAELHALSERTTRPLISRSCAELTESLLESELFGHERGAFTGATRERAGLFEAADGGTLFLDEVGEMTPALQSKLLRVLETGEVTRVGGTSSRTVDVRVIAATHRELAVEVSEGRFRQDLYYRLKVIELRVPSLRDRAEDIPLLAHHFLALGRASRRSATAVSTPRGFTHDALRALVRHPWPGNVRELRNVIERAVILAGEREEIGLDLLPEELHAGPSETTPESLVKGSDLPAARAAFERACLERALAECDGNRTHAARALGISIRTMQQKMAKHGIT
ncbi:MAG: sigma 54-interacting transcriptional regulator [Acidobacteriota bacterium]